MTIIIDTYLALAIAMGVWLYVPVRDAARALLTRPRKRMRPWPSRGIPGKGTVDLKRVRLPQGGSAVVKHLTHVRHAHDQSD